MPIGTAILLTAIIWFAIAYPGFRMLLLVGAALGVAVTLGLIVNQVGFRQNASYQPANVIDQFDAAPHPATAVAPTAH